MNLFRVSCALCAGLFAITGPLLAGAQETNAPNAKTDDRSQAVSAVIAMDGEWLACATRGIDGDIPQSVTAMLDDQGGWYTPFTRPNATGPYDIRNLHPQDGDAARPRC